MNESLPKGIDADTLTHEGIGCCIYCGSDGGTGGLHEEHVLPYSLGGNATIKNASCSDCEVITCKLDGFLANHIFHEVRVFRRIQSRTKTTTKTKEMPLTYRLNHGPQKTESLRIEDRPYQIIFPLFQPPGILTASKPIVEFKNFSKQVYTHFPPTFFDTIGAGAVGDIQITNKKSIDLHKFCRALAKIAIGYQLLVTGSQTYRRSEVHDIVLGRYPFTSHLIGGDGLPNDRATASLHEVRFSHVPANGRVYQVCSIRLFANCKDPEGMGPPTYRVMMGDATEALRARSRDPLTKT